MTTFTTQGPIDIPLTEDGHPIDTNTGEVTSYDPYDKSTELSVVDPIEALILTDALPIHIRKMVELEISSEVFASFTQVAPVDISPYLNRTVTVVGCCIWYHPTFKGMPDAEGNSSVKKGYFKVLMKLKETKKVEVTVNRKVIDIQVPVILSTSSRAVAEFMFAQMARYGWFDWKDGHEETVVFSGTQKTGYFATPIGKLLQAGASTAKE